VLTGDIRNQVDQVWNAFWTGGISNPLEVVEQFTYLLFIKRLDDLHTVRESKANRLGTAIEQPIFGPEDQALRWSHFKHREARQMYDIIAGRVFPFIKDLGGENSAFATYMRDARFTLPSEKPGLLARVVELLDRIPMESRDTKGDLYEYMLSKLATAGANGQFRTPRHIIQLMVDMVAPTPQDTICDPACGTAGFLVVCESYLRTHHPEIFTNAALRQHYETTMFNGFDFDSTMLRIATMNMMLHGVEQPRIQNRDSLAEEHTDTDGAYSLILANPPFAGSLDYETTAKDLLKIVKTKKTELLFLALFLRLLQPGGRAAVIVPDGVLFGSSTAHKALRRMLVEDHKLDGIVSMPSGVFKPYAGVSTAILFFTRTDSGGTDAVWFYDMQADGYSLDDKRTPLNGGHAGNNLPDILARWQNRAAERECGRTDQSFLVPKAEIMANDYDLSINRYKQVVYAETSYAPPLQILDELAKLEAEIQQGVDELRGMLA
jgi:type I restriction enzyme M protein